MQDEEKAKRKGKPYRKLFMLVPIIFVVVYLSFNLLTCRLIYGPPFSASPFIDGLYDEEIKSKLLANLPIDTSRSEVESFIWEHLQESENCPNTTGNDMLCRRIIGHAWWCDPYYWDIRFRFDADRLSEISVESNGICL